jgi:hypothetical protein
MDFHTAAAFRTAPSFPHICLNLDAPPLPNELMEEAACTSPTSPLQLSLAAIDCFNIFYRLHRLALAVSSHWLGRVARITLSNLLYEAQFIILSVPDYSRDFIDFDLAVKEDQGEYYEQRKCKADAASLVEALLAATLIFVYVALRALPSNTKIFSVLLSRLRVATDRPHMSAIEIWKRANNLNMLLWVLVVACSVASGEGRMWWIAKLSGVCDNLEVTSRYDLEERLRHVAWTDVFFSGEVARIWAEVLRLRRPEPCSTVLNQASTSTIDPAPLALEAYSKKTGLGYKGKGYSAPVDLEDGRWKVDNWYV